MESTVTAPLQTAFVAPAPEKIAGTAGRIVLFAEGGAALDPLARRVDRLTRGAVARLVASDAFAKAKAGGGLTLAFPAGLAAEARLAGATIAGFNGSVALTVLAGGQARIAEVAQGLVLRAYSFTTYRKVDPEAAVPNAAVTFAVKDPAAAEAAFAPLSAQAEGVYFTRDLVWALSGAKAASAAAGSLTAKVTAAFGTAASGSTLR